MHRDTKHYKKYKNNRKKILIKLFHECGNRLTIIYVIVLAGAERVGWVGHCHLRLIWSYWG